MKKKLTYIFVIPALIMGCDPENINPVTPDEPVIEETANEVTLACDSIMFCTLLPPSFAVSSTLDGHLMKAVINGLDEKPDTLEYESSASGPFLLPLVSKERWEDMKTQLCANAVIAGISGKVIDLTDDDTTEFSRTVRFLPQLIANVSTSESRVSLSITPQYLNTNFSLVTKADGLKINSITRLSPTLYAYSLTEPGEQVAEFVWSGFPDYRYKVKLKRVINEKLYIRLVESEEKIDGKSFSRIYPEIRLESSGSFASRTEDLDIAIVVRTKGYCEWNDDSDWGDPETQEKLKNGYHFPMNAREEFSDSVSVSGVSSARDAKPVTIPMDMTGLLFNYHPDVYLENTYLDPVSGLLGPVYTIPIPRHYYESEAFSMDVYYSCPGDPEMKYVELWPHMQYDEAFAQFISRMAEELRQESLVDDYGYSALLSWGETKPECTFHKVVPETVNEKENE